MSVFMRKTKLNANEIQQSCAEISGVEFLIVKLNFAKVPRIP